MMPCEQIPYAFGGVAMKIIRESVTALQSGVLTTIEIATAVPVDIPIAHLTDPTSKEPFVGITFGLFPLFPLALLPCQSFAWLVPAFVLGGLEEFGEPKRKALIMDPPLKTAMPGSSASTTSSWTCSSPLPPLAASFYGRSARLPTSLSAFCFGVFGTFGFAFYGRDL